MIKGELVCKLGDERVSPNVQKMYCYTILPLFLCFCAIQYVRVSVAYPSSLKKSRGGYPSQSHRLLHLHHNEEEATHHHSGPLDEVPSRRSLRDRRMEKRSSSSSVAKKSSASASSPSSNEVMMPTETANEEAEALNVIHDNSELPLFDSQDLRPIQWPHIKFYGLEELFPNTGLEALFHSNAAFRTTLRKAARKDFIEPLALKDLIKQNLVADHSLSSVQSSWRIDNAYKAMTLLFASNGIPLTGTAFIHTLSSLCGDSPHVFGSWMDIIGVKNRRIPHSWHQDSGLNQNTVMFGFPPHDNYEGIGVFSHAFRLSHQLPAPLVPGPRLWDISAVFDDIPERLVIRPLYRRGKEIMVYNDRDIFHSAPDLAFRESIWRLM